MSRWWMLSVCGTVSCAGNPFTLDPNADVSVLFGQAATVVDSGTATKGAETVDAQGLQDTAMVDSGPAARSTDAATMMEDSKMGLDAGIETSTMNTPEASPDVNIPEAGPDVNTPEAGSSYDSGGHCTPIPHANVACGQYSIGIPQSFCIIDPGGQSYGGGTPSACQCAETFMCGCILAGQPNPCGGTPAPTTIGCAVEAGVVTMTCQ